MRKLFIESTLFFLVALVIMMIILRLSTRAMSETCFKPIFKDDYGAVVYDIRTGVEYWRSETAYNYGTLTLLVNEEGKPLIYDE